MLNKIDLYSYFSNSNYTGDVCLFDLCVRPSQELVNKWMPLLVFRSESYQCYHFEDIDMYYASCDMNRDGDPVYVPAVELSDYFEAARILEVAEMACLHCRYRDDKKMKWIMPRIRVDLTKQPIKPKNQELTFEI